MIRWLRQWYRVCALLVLVPMVFLANYAVAHAEDATSSHYQVTDTQFGAGAGSGCSTSYCANSTAGDLVVGSGSSAHYQAEFGSDTEDMPLLEVIANGGSTSFGTLTTAAAATASVGVDVRAYEISGYTIQFAGAAPSQGEHQLDTPSTPTASQPGTEQFGINLVSNTFPTVGANPEQVPDSTFSFGQAATGYNTPDDFQYSDGAIVAQSDSSSGETDYTISMIINISDATPAGQYTGSYDAIVVPVY
jgi:hypothetical protein